MKIKTDFITNSSTTSFVVIGINLNISDIPEDYLKPIAEERNILIENVTEDSHELMDYLLKGSDLQYAFLEYASEAMVGIRYSSMNDDETLRDFRSRVRLQILEKLGVTSKPYHIEEAWRDG